MLSQFRLRYPQGSLISELIQIDHGKYIVRSLVQVDGVTLASGLAAADTVEGAEDQARIRALSLLNWEATPKVTPAIPTASVAPKATKKAPPTEVPKVVPLTQKTESISPLPISEAQPENPIPSQPQVLEIPTITPTPQPQLQPVTIPEDNSETLSVSEPQVLEIPTINPTPELQLQLVEPILDISPPIAEVLSSEIVKESVLEESLALSAMEEVEIPQELIPRVSEAPILEPLEILGEVSTVDQSETPIPESSPEPIDFSDIIVRSNVELKRLNWTNEQGRNYLLQTYGKRSRQLLSDEELLEFLQYLEIQPTPAVK